jgi:hypothetical protein
MSTPQGNVRGLICSLGEHAVFDLAEKLFYHTSADLGTQHFERSAVAETLLGFFEPCTSAINAFKDTDGMIEDADDSDQLVGLTLGERLAAGTALLEGTGRNNDVVKGL